MPSRAFPSSQRMYVPHDVLSASSLIYFAKRKPVDISIRAPVVVTPPKRRRIPITIVEPDAEPSPTTSIVKPSSTSDTSLMTAVSSQPLSKSSSLASPMSQPPTKSASIAFATPDASNSPQPPPQTFCEAKAAREELKPVAYSGQMADPASSMLPVLRPPARMRRKGRPQRPSLRSRGYGMN